MAEDKNTQKNIFVLACAVEKNQIKGLTKHDGKITTDGAEMEAMVNEFSSNLYTAEGVLIWMWSSMLFQQRSLNQ